MIGTILRTLRRTVANCGARAIHDQVDALQTAYEDWRFDRRFGTETEQILSVEELDIESENRDQGFRYQPTQVRPFKLLMSTLDIHRDSSFVDFGSGMGRALMLAAENGFQRVVGVEYAKSLCEIADKNIEVYRRKSATQTRFSILPIDAADYAIQSTDSVFYFYNPFSEAVMEKVIENIHQSVLKAPRKVYIVYLNPICRKVIENHPAFELIFEKHYGFHRFVVFSSTFLIRVQGAVNQLGRV